MLSTRERAKARVFSFLKSERLSGKKNFDTLFKSGRAVYGSGLRLVYYFEREEIPLVLRVGFSVPRRIHRRAVRRNCIKRMMREAFRLLKKSFRGRVGAGRLDLLFIYQDTRTPVYAELSGQVTLTLEKLLRRLNENTDAGVEMQGRLLKNEKNVE